MPVLPIKRSPCSKFENSITNGDWVKNPTREVAGVHTLWLLLGLLDRGVPVVRSRDARNQYSAAKGKVAIPRPSCIRLVCRTHDGSLTGSPTEPTGDVRRWQTRKEDTAKSECLFGHEARQQSSIYRLLMKTDLWKGGTGPDKTGWRPAALCRTSETTTICLGKVTPFCFIRHLLFLR